MSQWTLPKIKKALKEVKEKGWIKSNRSHNTGIGKTLEDELGIQENNIALPDFGTLELKSQRIKTQSMLTLFTKKPEGITNKEIREKFGYKDGEFPNIKCLRQTINGNKKNAKGFHCKIDRGVGKLFIKKNNAKIGFYTLSFLEKKAEEKIGDGLILVLADTKTKNGHEYFHYKEGYLLQDIEPTKFIEYLKYDIRLGVYKSGALRGVAHDHGSAFRLRQNAIAQLFRIKKKIL